MRKAQNSSGDQFTGTTADKITVELHKASPYSEIAYTFSNIDLNINGTASISFPFMQIGSYFITIRHRNSIETTTLNPVQITAEITNYSFDDPSKAYGNNLKLINGKYCLYGGDVNQDGFVDTNDLNLVYNSSNLFTTGYLAEDVNGDGIIDAMDLILLDNNASISVSKISP